MINTLKRLFLVSRPISWPNTAYPFVVGYVVSGGSNWLVLVIATLYFLIPYNLLMYGINDVFDYESDIRNPRKGGIEGMKEQRQFHPTIIRWVLITNIPFLVALYALGDIGSAIILTIVVFLVVAYSIAKLRFKEIPVLDSLTSSMHFVGPLLVGLSLSTWHPTAWPYIWAFFFWGIASHALGAVQDIIPDRAGKLASIATFLGANHTLRFAFILYTIASVIIILQPLPFALIGVAGLVYACNIIRYLGISDRESMKANRPWKRFIWINLCIGFVTTIVVCAYYLTDIFH
jgi:4-hydroxybenzoate polyprenyltransferase